MTVDNLTTVYEFMYAEMEYFFYGDVQIGISLMSSTGYFLVLVTLSASCMSFRMINHVLVTGASLTADRVRDVELFVQRPTSFVWT